jgi:hypothetical protein
MPIHTEMHRIFLDLGVLARFCDQQGVHVPLDMPRLRGSIPAKYDIHKIEAAWAPYHVAETNATA